MSNQEPVIQKIQILTALLGSRVGAYSYTNTTYPSYAGFSGGISNNETPSPLKEELIDLDKVVIAKLKSLVEQL